MRKFTRSSATREDLLWELDKKTAALKRIDRICSELITEDEIGTPQFLTVTKIRNIASQYYPILERTSENRLVVKPL